MRQKFTDCQLNEALHTVADAIFGVYVLLTKSNMVAEVTGNRLQVAGNRNNVTATAASAEGTKEKESEKCIGTANDCKETLHSEAEALCEYMAEAIRRRKPDAKISIGKKWHTEADRLMRLDGRDPGEVRNVIDWVTAHRFWAPNILSVAKLRAKYDALVMQMEDERRPIRDSTGCYMPPTDLHG